jgi:hypothetical protein
MANEQRMLSIKLGAVTRLSKELALYKDEERNEIEKVQKLKSEQADPHDIKYAVSQTTDLRSSSNRKVNLIARTHLPCRRVFWQSLPPWCPILCNDLKLL